MKAILATLILSATPLAAQDIPGTSPTDMQTYTRATTSSAIDRAALDSVAADRATGDARRPDRAAREAASEARRCADLRRAYAARGLDPRRVCRRP